MALIVDNLYNNTTLNELDVRYCKLSAKGTINVSIIETDLDCLT